VTSRPIGPSPTFERVPSAGFTLGLNSLRVRASPLGLPAICFVPHRVATDLQRIWGPLQRICNGPTNEPHELTRFGSPKGPYLPAQSPVFVQARLPSMGRSAALGFGAGDSPGCGRVRGRTEALSALLNEKTRPTTGPGE
jgi:hypothetical protein